MEKYFKLLILCISLLFFATLSVHADIRHDVSICTAEVKVGGTAATEMNIIIRNRFDHSVTNRIEWTNIEWQKSGWEIANEYVVLHFECSLPKWYIVLATENTNSTLANPKFTGDPNKAAGLVNTATSNETLSLVWQIQTSSNVTPVISPPVDMGGGQYAFTNTGWMWKYILDKAQRSFTNTSGNTTPIDPINGTWGPTNSDLPINYYAVPLCKGVNQGAQDPPGTPYGADDGRLWGSGPWERGDPWTWGNMYIFWAADFKTASMTTYKTTAIKFELYLQ